MADALDSDRPVRWGILGCGRIAATVGADIASSSGSEIVAVAARDADRAAAFARDLGVATAYGSYGELVADPSVDVVYIATTHAQHHEHALLALDAGKPILVEKAFTLNARQAREVVALARERNLFCMEAMWMRLSPLVLDVVERARAGQIGEITTVRAELSKAFDFDPVDRLFDLAVGGGALLDLGVYPLHFVWAVLGKPSGVAVAGRLAPTGSDLVAALQLSYPTRAVAQVLTSAATDSPEAAVVCGTAGWIRLEPRIHRAASFTIAVGDQEETVVAERDPGNGYHHQVAEVERCLRAGLLESPAIPLDDTVAVLELIDQARAELGVVYPSERST